MRLRLTIRRNALPDTKLLWRAKATQTISQLLTAVDEHFPLEADHWGVDDYVVLVAGYEAIHYHKVGDILKEGDRVMCALFPFISL